MIGLPSGSDGRRVAIVLSLFLIAATGLSSIADAQEFPPDVSLLDDPYLTIGSVVGGGAAAVELTSVAGALLLPSGGIVVADGGSRLVHWFDADGTLLRSVGGEGEGPGEFQYIDWVGVCPGGELLVLDPMAGRATFLASADGHVVRTQPLPTALWFSSVLICRSGDRLLVLMDQGGAGRVAPEMLGRVVRVPAKVVYFDLPTGAVDTLQRLPGRDFYYSNKVSGFSYLPLGGRALAATGGGRLYVAQSDAEDLRVMHLPSGRWTAFEHRLPRPPVNREAWDRAVSSFVWRQPLERTRQLLMRVLEDAPPPERQPAFLAMRADPAGRVWLRLPGTGEVNRWRVLDHDGHPFATVRLPPNVEPLEIGARRLLALERGPLDVPLVRVYELPGALRP